MGLGGCPSATERGSTGDQVGNLNEEGTSDGTISLRELAAQIAAADASYGQAWSTESTTISVNPHIDVGDTYERIHTPWLSTGTSGDNSGFLDWRSLFGADELDGPSNTGDTDGPDGDDGTDDGGSDDDGSDDGDDWDEDDCFDADDDPGVPPGGYGSTTYEGIVECVYTEELIGYGDERSREECYLFALARNDRGVLGNIPVPVPCIDDVMLADVHVVGDIDTRIIRVSSRQEYTVTVTVVSASYTAGTANLVLDLDSVWIGEYSGIVSRGEQTLQAQLVDGNLVYSSEVHWEIDLWAGEEWSGDAIVTFDFDGVLTP
jgi:hypothetical protein